MLFDVLSMCYALCCVTNVLCYLLCYQFVMLFHIMFVLQMTLHYQTLKEYGRTFKLNRGESYMNIAVSLAGVIFPVTMV